MSLKFIPKVKSRLHKSASVDDFCPPLPPRRQMPEDDTSNFPGMPDDVEFDNEAWSATSSSPDNESSTPSNSQEVITLAEFRAQSQIRAQQRQVAYEVAYENRLESQLRAPFSFDDTRPRNAGKELRAPRNVQDWCLKVITQRWFQSIGGKFKMSAAEFDGCIYQGFCVLDNDRQQCIAYCKLIGQDHDYDCQCQWDPKVILLHKWVCEIMDETEIEKNLEWSELLQNGENEPQRNTHFEDGTWAFPQAIDPLIMANLPLPYAERRKFFNLATEYQKQLFRGIGNYVPVSWNSSAKREIPLKLQVSYLAHCNHILDAMRDMCQNIGGAIKQHLSQEFSAEQWSQMQSDWNEIVARESEEAEWAAQIRYRVDLDRQQAEENESNRLLRERREAERGQSEGQEEKVSQPSRIPRPTSILHRGPDFEPFRDNIEISSDVSLAPSFPEPENPPSRKMSPEKLSEVLKPDKFNWADWDDEDDQAWCSSQLTSSASAEVAAVESPMPSSPQAPENEPAENPFLSEGERDDEYWAQSCDVFVPDFDAESESPNEGRVKVSLGVGTAIPASPSSEASPIVLPQGTEINIDEDMSFITPSEPAPVLHLETSIIYSSVIEWTPEVEQEDATFNACEDIQSESPMVLDQVPIEAMCDMLIERSQDVQSPPADESTPLEAPANMAESGEEDSISAEDTILGEDVVTEDDNMAAGNSMAVDDTVVEGSAVPEGCTVASDEEHPPSPIVTSLLYLTSDAKSTLLEVAEIDSSTNIQEITHEEVKEEENIDAVGISEGGEETESESTPVIEKPSVVEKQGTNPISLSTGDEESEVPHTTVSNKPSHEEKDGNCPFAPVAAERPIINEYGPTEDQKQTFRFPILRIEPSAIAFALVSAYFIFSPRR